MAVVETNERLTWEQIQERYPDQWVGMIDVEKKSDNTSTVESGIVKYVGYTKSQLTRMVLDGKCTARHTNPDGCTFVGVLY